MPLFARPSQHYSANETDQVCADTRLLAGPVPGQQPEIRTGLIGLFVVAQAALMFVSVDLTRKRREARPHVAIPVAATAFAVGFMSIAILLSVLVLFSKDAVFDLEWFWLIFPVSIWLFWGIVFYLYRDRVSARLDRTVAWLLRGSIRQLLVAVPTHVYVRHRDDCCAPMVTGYRIATGIALMLMTFGPSAVFLYQRRLGEYRIEQATLERGKWPMGVSTAILLGAIVGVYLFVPVEPTAAATGTADIAAAEVFTRTEAMTRLATDHGMTLVRQSRFLGVEATRWQIRCKNRTVALIAASPGPGSATSHWMYELYAGTFKHDADYARFTDAVRTLNERTGGLDSYEAQDRGWLTRLTARTRSGTVFGFGCDLAD